MAGEWCSIAAPTIAATDLSEPALRKLLLQTPRFDAGTHTDVASKSPWIQISVKNTDLSRDFEFVALHHRQIYTLDTDQAGFKFTSWRVQIALVVEVGLAGC